VGNKEALRKMKIEWAVTDAKLANREIGIENREIIENYRTRAIIYIKYGQSGLNDLDAMDPSRKNENEVSIWDMEDNKTYYIPRFYVRRNASNDCCVVDPDVIATSERSGISFTEVEITKKTEMIKDHFNFFGLIIRIKPRYSTIFNIHTHSKENSSFTKSSEYEEFHWKNVGSEYFN